jgi:small subunit ribosomal protein S8
MLTRIRNAIGAQHDTVEIIHSKTQTEIARILKREGYIADYVVEGGGAKKLLRVYLKYVGNRESAIRGLKRVSSPGRRDYQTADKIPLCLGGMGIVVMSTSSGIMTGREAKKKKIGGDVICSVW